jgi:hypothetical protein
MSTVTLINKLYSDSSILPEELATQSVRLKEEQLRREEEKVGGNKQLILIVLTKYSCGRIAS